MQEKGVEGKNKIKDRFNELAKQIKIDTSAFMAALLKKREMKKQLNNSASVEDVSIPNQIEESK